MANYTAPNLMGNVQGAGQAGSGVSNGLAQGVQYGAGKDQDPNDWAIQPGSGFDPGGVKFVGGHGADGYGINGRPTTPQWGGKVGGAEQTAGQLSGLAAAAGSRPGQNLAGLGLGHQGGIYADPNADAAQQAYNRTLAKGAIAGLANSASGQGPSAATMQMGAALGGSSLSDAYAAMRGGAGASAVRGLGATNAGVVGQGGAGRAGEVADAQGHLVQASNALRGSDLRQQGLAQTAGLDQAQADLATSRENEQTGLAYDTMAQQTLGDQLNAATSTYNTSLGNTAQLGAINLTNQAAQGRAYNGAALGAASGLMGSMGGAQTDEEYANAANQGNGGDPYGGAGEEGTSFGV